MPDERIGFRAVEIAPDPANARAVRSYAKAGFRTMKRVYVTGEEPANTGDELVMLQTREEFMMRDTGDR